MSDQPDVFRDQPRSYRELVAESVTRHRRSLFLGIFVLYSFGTLLSVVLIVHTQVTEIGVLADAEAGGHLSIGEVNLPGGLYTSLVINTMVAISALHTLVAEHD